MPCAVSCNCQGYVFPIINGSCSTICGAVLKLDYNNAMMVILIVMIIVPRYVRFKIVHKVVYVADILYPI